MSERIEQVTGSETPFLDGPAEFLVKTLVKELKSVSQFSRLFGEAIDGYKRMDYGIRNLPALRIYNNSYMKDFESWFENGDVLLDVILPPNLRRDELEQVQSTISAALVQQFRRPQFFDKVEESVPGLNELGKRVNVDKSLGFEWGEEVVPLLQITMNFRIDLRQWDQYLEQSDRTKDEPFEKTLGDLERLLGVIPGLNDVNVKQVEVGTDQDL